MIEIPAHELERHVGRELGISDWAEVGQPLIDAFADLTEDRQFIHIDPARAKAEGPFGTTVAHGLLTLALLPKLAKTGRPAISGERSAVNYGFDRVRGRFTLKRAEPRGPDAVLTVWEVKVEAEGAEKPVLLAEWLSVRNLEKADA